MAGDHEVGAAQRRVHDAAGGAEDHRRAGTGAQGAVELRLFHDGGIDLLAPQHADELAGGQHHVHVRIAAGTVQVGDGPLRLLGGAGHDGHHIDVVGIHPQLLGKVALGHRAEHGLGRLGGGQIGGVFRELALHEPHPAGAAGGEHGPLVLVAVGEPLQKLRALLHDGQVGGKVGVENVVEADLLQRCYHPLGGGELGVKVIVLRPGGPDGGRDLHHGDSVGIRQRVPHLAGVIVLLQSAHGTVGDALAAKGAVRLAQRVEAAHAHGGAGTGAHHIPDVHGLDLLAHLDAPHAADAAVFDAHHRVGEIGGDVFQVLDVVVTQQVIVVAQCLELAAAAAGTLGAADLMLAEDQPQVHAPCLTDSGRVGVHHHALHHGVVAGGHQPRVPLHLHHTDAARGDLVDILEIAQGGDADIGAPGGLQNGRALRHGDHFLVDRQSYHLLFRPPLKIP